MPNVAETVAVVFDDTAFVVKLKVEVVVPEAKVTVAGTTTFVEEDMRFTTSPLPLAADCNVSKPDTPLPPVTVVGFKLKP